MTSAVHGRPAVKLLSLAWLLWSTLLWSASASATVVVPVDDSDLIADAVWIVTGQVTAIESFWDAAQRGIFTGVTIAVEDVLKGEVTTPEITVKQSGGAVGDIHSWVHGNPEFAVGERVLVLLTANADGTPRVAHLHQGKFSITVDALTGEEWAQRDADPAGVLVLPAPGGRAAPSAIRRRRDLEAEIRAHVAAGHGRARRTGSPARVVAPATTATASFTFFSTPARWFEPDSGLPVPIRINALGLSQAPGLGFDQARAAMAAWSSVAGSQLVLQDAGFTTVNQMAYDGVNALTFGDVQRLMDPPVGCTGILALGGYSTDASATRVVNGTTFVRILDGDVSINDGWAGCGFYYEVFANLAEVITHEFGHVVGFGHSRDANATMAAFAHFDGRGASLMADDVAAVRFSYSPLRTFTLSVTRSGPGAGTVTSDTGGITCGSDCAEDVIEGTSVTLTARAAAGSTFTGWSGACSGLGTCTVIVSTALDVTATFSMPNLVVTAISNPPASAVPGTRFTTNDVTVNVGAGTARASRTRYYLAIGPERSTTDRRLSAIRPVRSLDAGLASAGTRTLRVPAGMAAGTYYLLACADDTHVVTESDEADNCLASSTTVVVTRPN